MVKLKLPLASASAISPGGGVRPGAVLFPAALCLCLILQSPRLPRAAPAGTPDITYLSLHPRLLFSPADHDSLWNKVHDGGADDDAYSFIKLYADYIYPGATFDDILDGDFGLGAIPSLGVLSFLEAPLDSTYTGLGRDLTLYVANNWSVDFDVYYSSLRLRCLALGYDMFFQRATPAERDLVKQEMLAYMDSMMTAAPYQVYHLRPYLSNKTAMIAAALGLAAVCLQGEADSTFLAQALAYTDELATVWYYYQVDPEGPYNEGVLYGAWSMRHLVYYFEARRRFDGYDYLSKRRLKDIEKWLAYELLPEGGGRVNNLNDCAYDELSLSMNNTYFEWALNRWSSGLSAWLWEHTSGTYGVNYGMKADQAATVLWHQPVPPVQPDSILPPSIYWSQRGLYYYRTGWPTAASSGDVVFSFYAGKFQGGHAQEDQGQFTLYGYGGKFAIDHGPGTRAKESEAHNMVFVDGKGQHNAGSSIGTDGEMNEYLTSPFADYLDADLTLAYTTHSPLNNPGFPLPGTDWSWGYDGGNPVVKAQRRVLVIHGNSSLPPAFVIDDLVDKDGFPHDYQWRMHTYFSNAIDTTANPIRITGGSGFLDLFVLNPAFSGLSIGIEYFNNLMADPNSNILSMQVSDTVGRFIVVMVPNDGTTQQPAVIGQHQPWGKTCSIIWPDGTTDFILINDSGAPVSHTFTGGALQYTPAPLPPGGAQGTATISTDASLALIRNEASAESPCYLLAGVTTCLYNDTALATSFNGPFTVARSTASVHISRYDADFSLYAPGVTEVFYHEQKIPFSSNGSFITRDFTTGPIPAAPSTELTVTAFPNPFNPSVTVKVTSCAATGLRAEIYDVEGRSIAVLYDGPARPGVQTLRWEGRDRRGAPVSSGVYLLKVTTKHGSKSLKLVLVR